MLAFIALAVAHPDPSTLRCVVHGDRIDIMLPADTDPRIGSMAGVRRERWAFLADEENKFSSFRPGIRHLTVRPSKQLAAVDGRTVRAFPRSGTYRIVFADNLETEPENMMALDCLVHVHIRRKGG